MTPLGFRLGVTFALLALLSGCGGDSRPEPTYDEQSLQSVLNKGERLKGEANLKAIQSAIEQFKAAQERNPASLDELVKTGLLQEMPAAPRGKKFAYHPENGRVEIEPDPSTDNPKQSSLTMPSPAEAMSRALDVQAKADLKKITVALNVYMTEHDGRFPERLEELVSSGMLEQLPTPPANMKFAYDPKTGKVDLAAK